VLFILPQLFIYSRGGKIKTAIGVCFFEVSGLSRLLLWELCLFSWSIC